MNNNINQQIEETLDSLSDIQKVGAPANLHIKILNRINQPKKEVYLFRHPQWMIAALVIGIICNVGFAISYHKTSSIDTGSETTNVSSFVSQFKLGTNSIY